MGRRVLVFCRRPGRVGWLLERMGRRDPSTRFEAAWDVEEVERLIADKPDLLLWDLERVDHRELAAIPRIKAIAPKTPIVLLSSEPDAAVLDAGYAAGAAGLIVYPSDVSRNGVADRILDDLQQLLES